VTAGGGTDRAVAVVVLVGDDAEALGVVARELEAAGRRTAVFVGDVTAPAERAALDEMLDELFA
jgi:hypothetical protein